VTLTVIQHVLARLRMIGVTDVFGVPGDYSFAVTDAICNDPRLRWIGCCSELDAAYAADGYARVRRVRPVPSNGRTGGLRLRLADGHATARLGQDIVQVITTILAPAHRS
jgi:indolepyruvate decarboxylase